MVALTVNATEAPVLALDNLSWGTAKKIMAVAAKIRKVGDDGEAISAAFEAMEQLIAPLIITLPRDWFVRGATEVADYAEPGAFDDLKRGKFVALINAVMTRIAEEDDATKN